MSKQYLNRMPNPHHTRGLDFPERGVEMDSEDMQPPDCEEWIDRRTWIYNLGDAVLIPTSRVRAGRDRRIFEEE